MAVVINQNIPSMTAQRFLGNANSGLAKSIEKLSSGLRINHASDDASGLAISEKLRGQISGLKRASMNAQDGISMLQTAEGGLQNVQDMLQRMRELSVQAGNGIYTSNDRAEIQKEVDQLKDEINRTSSSTEFNTKKLLNGDATALWSSDSDKIDTIIRGEVAEGNYNLEITASPGKNNVYKTDVMTLNEGAFAAEVTTNAVLANEVNDIAGLNSTMDSTGNYTLTLSKTDVTADATIAVDAYKADASSDVANLATATATAGNTITKSGYVEIEFTSSFTDTTTTAASTLNSVAKVRFYDAADGSLSEWSTANWNNTTSTLEIAGLDGTETLALAGTDTDSYFAGDKALVYVLDSSTVDSSAATNAQVSINDSYGKTSVQEVAAVVSGTSEVNSKVYLAEIDGSTGDVNFGSFNVEMGKATDAVAGDLAFDVATGGDRATVSTELKDVARFTTADGRNIFDNTQELTIFGNGSSTSIFLEGSDTVEDMETKLTDALKELGMGSDISTVNDNLVEYVTSSTANSDQAVAGTFVIQSALLGEDSEISFVGDQALIDGLSVANIQEGEASEVSVTVTNAHTGETVGADKVNDNMLRDVISGVDVKIGSDLGITSTWDATNKEIDFAASSSASNVKLHLVSNSTELQIGANEGQTLSVSIGQMDTTSLDIDDALVVTQEAAQSTITKIDNALNSVSSTRATIGAQINRLEYTITGLDTTRENLAASESRIRDLDIADEMAEFTKNQILSQAATAMLSQANQLPQMALQLLG